MSNNTKKLINRIIMVLTCCMILFSLSCVYGQGTIDPNSITKPPVLTTGDTQTAINKISPIISYITGIGMAVSVITLVVLGIKYMVGSIEERINAMQVEEVEELVLSIMNKELGAIVNLGAVIGLILGLINVIIFII